MKKKPLIDLVALSSSHSSLFERAKTQNDLVDALVTVGALQSKEVIDTFRRVDRSLFVGKRYAEPFLNQPVKISSTGATISTPSHHALITETIWKHSQPLLRSNKKLRVLDLGCGSGYVTVLLATLFNIHSNLEAVEVVGTEAVDTLMEMSRHNIKRQFGAVENIKLNIEIFPAFEENSSEQNKKVFQSGKPYDIIHIGFSVSDQYIRSVLKPSLTSKIGIILAPIIQTKAQEQMLTLYKEEQVVEIAPVLCQHQFDTNIREDLRTIEQRIEEAQLELNEWITKFERVQGRKPSTAEMFGDPTAKELFIRFSTLRKGKWH